MVTTPLMLGRETLNVKDVVAALTKRDHLQGVKKVDDKNVAFTVERRRAREKNDRRWRGGSSLKPRAYWSNKECYYCHDIRHKKAYCKKLMEDLWDFMKSKRKEDEKKSGENYTNVAVVGDSDEEDVVLVVQEEKKDTRDMWLFDFSCFEHVYTRKEWVSKLEMFDKPVYMANGDEEKIEGIGSVKVHLHDGSVNTFGNVRYVPKFTRNLILLGNLNSLGYGYSCRGGSLKITKGSMIVTKGVKNF